MKKITALFVAGLFCAAFSSPALAAGPYDRYERYREPGPPPRGAGAPPPQHAVYGQTYFLAHGGLFEPNNYTDGLRGYDTGWHFDFGVGSRVSPFLAIEGIVGAYGADTGGDEVRVVPVTIGGRLVLPQPFLEPYVGGGVGIYFAHLKERRANPFVDIDDSNTTVGGYASIGLDAWLNPRTALNFEGKYHFANPSFKAAAGNSIDVDVSGWALNLGVRLSF